MKYICLAVMLSVMFQILCFADSKGEFPGKGDYEKWKQASNLADEGIELAKRGSLQQAISVYNQAAEVYSFDSSVFYNKGIAQKKLGDFNGAVQSFAKAVSLEPKFASAWYNLGNAYDAAGNLPEGEKALREASRLEPRHFNAAYNLGMNLFNQKQYGESKIAFDHALELALNEQDRSDTREFLEKVTAKLRKVNGGNDSK